MADRHWSQVQESGALLGMKVMFFVYRVLGRWAFGLLLYPVITYFFLARRQARSASMDYLNRVRQQGALPASTPLWQQSFSHFLHFGRNLLDKLAAWTGAFNYDNVRFHRRDDFLQMVDRQQGALVIVSHLGNLEVCRALADSSKRIRLNILVHTKHAEKFNRLMNDLDNDNHLNLLQVTDVSPATAMLLNDKLSAGEVVVIAGDRTPVNGGRQTDVDFLGAPAAFPQGPYILASVLRCPVYLMFCAKGEDGYEIFFEKFAERIRLSRNNRDADLRHWTTQFAQRLAHYTLRYPLQWNNFYPFWSRAQADQVYDSSST
ncbi:hypothetical protein HBA55_31810 [Pseudomaricurvus alkylphenolicus]|jgi:predicted LPLAT superfamily acyltransferase|uniref:LpxL/LpxP family acyltransferase n=1 Tax=Pseudomaricurvus alkylphenolicus TaxID=1306991 RepID=UPI001420A98E|nr:hypothetical protein [Pseudomaricurvus alkylphenolicus]NIB44229.1 hypothetical protein [Pseudomaricurvus alkylphenolicus]